MSDSWRESMLPPGRGEIVILQRVESPDFLSNAYLIVDEPGGHGVLVDSNGSQVTEPLVERVEREGTEITHVLLTHHHWDHVLDVEELAGRFEAPILAHPKAADLLEGKVSETMDEGDAIESGELRIEVLHTPGHCADHLALVVDGSDCLTADVIFKGTVGGTRAPGATGFEDLKGSIMDKLMKLPPETRIHPGHRQPSTVGEEWEHNPFVRIWRGLDSRARSRSPLVRRTRTSASRRPWCSGPPTTTAGTRHGFASTTDPTPSSAARRSSGSRRRGGVATLRRVRAWGLITAAVAAVVLAGCVGFDGKPTGKQISPQKVQIKFKVCRAGDTKTCSDQGDWDSDNVRLLIGLRAPKGTDVPGSFTPVGSDVGFVSFRPYARQLNELAPKRDGYRYFGWVSDESRTGDAWPATGRFRLKLGLPNDPGRRFRFRPVVGYQEVGAKGPPRLDCGPNAYSQEEDANATCVDAPDTPADTRPSIKVPLD